MKIRFFFFISVSPWFTFRKGGRSDWRYLSVGATHLGRLVADFAGAVDASEAAIAVAAAAAYAAGAGTAGATCAGSGVAVCTCDVWSGLNCRR